MIKQHIFIIENNLQKIERSFFSLVPSDNYDTKSTFPTFFLNFSNTCNMHILYVMSGQSSSIVLTWFDKLVYPVWISAPPANTRLTYDTVWFSFANRSISMTFKLSRRNSHNAPFSTQKELCKAFLNYFLLNFV
jgi:hypothetical protein